MTYVQKEALKGLLWLVAFLAAIWLPIIYLVHLLISIFS